MEKAGDQDSAAVKIAGSGTVERRPRVLGLPIVSPASSPSQEPQMSEYCNTAYAGVLSQGSSYSYQYLGRNVANESEGTNMQGLQG
ncbi:uncharacterized protein LOC104436678 [Eucalyptus grandis]|uniref:uncharacterized protein LOC104436678 n=1 Tax=Eucalyptus grandis TaxID=71139 RepID=UPI00192ED8A9|nr:uncharacterized protein LOC104436678 [Eucalyptus grandis]